MEIESMIDIAMGILALCILLGGMFMLIQGTSAMNNKK